MGKMETTLKSEIVRLAKKKLRAVCGPLSRNVRQLKRKVSLLQRAVLILERLAALWEKQSGARQALLQAPEEEVKSARFSAGLIRKLRARLGISQQNLGTLVGVTATAVAFWEQGRSRPSETKKTALVALRKCGRRGVRRLLKMKEAEQPKDKRQGRGRKAGKKKRGGGKKRQ